MAITYTIEQELGGKAPDFRLPDVVDDKQLGFSDVKGENGTVVVFMCNHCPYVIHIRQQLLELASQFIQKGVGFVGISSNSVQSHPQDGPEEMRALAREENFPFPYLFDESQEVAKAYSAACTPDIFVYDEQDGCVYRGRFDASTPGNDEPVTGGDLRRALERLLAGNGPLEGQIPSMGCNIKWIPGNEPAYFG